MSRLISLLVGAVLWSLLSTHAQMGLRISPLNYENVEKGANMGFVFGADADLSDRTAMAFDYGFAFDLFGDGSNTRESLSYDGYQVDVSTITRTRNFTLRSLYFFSDMAGGPYIATSIGIRTVILELDPSVWDTNSSFGFPAPAWARATESKTTLTQLGLRVGSRSELDGYYGEFYIGVGVNLGELDGMLPPYMAASDWSLSRTYFQAGYSFGIGW
ncbi:MAG: hypothetical protein MUE88_01295 [Flavobacteriales bacterium]|jgi:hypothetical protein|nr:hypothetical protein [Flavobacteriales bacterium]